MLLKRVCIDYVHEFNKNTVMADTIIVLSLIVPPSAYHGV